MAHIQDYIPNIEMNASSGEIIAAVNGETSSWFCQLHAGQSAGVFLRPC